MNLVDSIIVIAVALSLLGVAGIMLRRRRTGTSSCSRRCSFGCNGCARAGAWPHAPRGTR